MSKPDEKHDPLRGVGTEVWIDKTGKLSIPFTVLMSTIEALSPLLCRECLMSIARAMENVGEVELIEWVNTLIDAKESKDKH